MHNRRFTASGILALGLALLVVPMRGSLARPTFFTNQCASCHSNDTPTCNGCHYHIGTLSATADRPAYYPGDAVTVTLNGGTQTGWIRAILYNENHTELVRRTGPTHTGDDGQANPVVFPVSLQTTAPLQLGDHVWQASWFGNNDGSGHIENLANVTIRVVQDPAAIEDPPALLKTWGWLRSAFR